MFAPAAAAPLVVGWTCVSMSGPPVSSDCGARRVSWTTAVAAALAAPLPPTQLQATIVGSRVSLSWVAASGGDAASSYIVEAGSAAGLVNLANFDTGSVASALIVDGVPAGTYFVRVRARNTAGVSAPSNEVIAAVGVPSCATVPDAPTGLVARAAGTAVTLTWRPPVSGCAPLSYRVEAGTGPLKTDRGTLNVSETAVSAANLAPGIYFVRVRGLNAAGIGPATDETYFMLGSSFLSYQHTPADPRYPSANWTADNSTFIATSNPVYFAFNFDVLAKDWQRGTAVSASLSIASRLGTPLAIGTYENTSNSTYTAGPFLSLTGGSIVVVCLPWRQSGRFTIDDVQYGQSPVPTRLHVTFELSYCGEAGRTIGELLFVQAQ